MRETIPPIGIILCTGKNEALVKCATMGLPQQVFVSKYLINLPSVDELQNIIEYEKFIRNPLFVRYLFQH